jgi:uncharacterized protein (DUF1684 family)
MPPSDPLALLDWKRRVFELYARVRSAADPREARDTWAAARADLFRNHSQSPVSEKRRRGSIGPSYFDYDPALRVEAKLRPATHERFDIPTSGDETMSFTRFARALLPVLGEEAALEVYWLEGYGGGLFLPFRDSTSGTETYGAGRYVLDTIKGADLGMADDRLVVDFNFAYNPSCAYDPRWVCPLAPPPNRLDVGVRAGERTPDISG